VTQFGTYADTFAVPLPKQTGSLLGALAVGLQLPFLLTLFVFRDAFPIGTTFGLAVLTPYIGIAGLVVARHKRSRLGVALSGLSLGGAACVLLIVWAVAAAFGQG
jgi:hypothetical protein